MATRNYIGILTSVNCSAHVASVVADMFRRNPMTGHDPLHTLASRLIAQGLADESVLERIRTDVQTEIDSAVQFALAAPYPEPSEVHEDVYA